METWERAMESFEASPWMVYAGSEPKYITDAKARGWARIEQLAAEGDETAIEQLTRKPA